MTVNTAAAERNRLARTPDRRTFERGDVIACGRTGRVAWVVGHVSVDGVVVHSDRATRYLRDNDLDRLRVLCPAHVTPDLETARGHIVAGLRDRQRI